MTKFQKLHLRIEIEKAAAIPMLIAAIVGGARSDKEELQVWVDSYVARLKAIQSAIDEA